MEQIGQTIKARRKELRAEKKELEEKLAESKGNPSLKTLMRILDILGLELCLK